VGTPIYVKSDNNAVPAGVATEIFPDAPAPTTAVIDVEETTLNEAAGVPPKVTWVAPVNLVPVIVIVLPAWAFAGEKEVMVGIELLLFKIETALAKKLGTAISGKPSPLKSPMVIFEGP
jgi:hypothetical protein